MSGQLSRDDIIRSKSAKGGRSKGDASELKGIYKN